MKLPQELTKVTRFSKTVALVLFVFLPILFFYLGLRYSNPKEFPPLIPINEGPPYTACTQEAKMCPDGSSVGREGPNCEFAPCPGSPDSKIPPSDSNVVYMCERNNGVWLVEYNECVSQNSDYGLSQEACTKLGGEFDECASPCRNNPRAEACIEVCESVCKFSNNP